MEEITQVRLRCLSQLNTLMHLVYTYALVCFQMIKHNSGGDGRGYNK